MDEQFIIKDTWHDPKRWLTEGQILQALKGIANVPEFVAEVVVSQYHRSRTLVSRRITVNCDKGGIECLQDELGAGRFDDCVHLWLQTKASNAKLVTNFKNREELAAAMLCCIQSNSFTPLFWLNTFADPPLMIAHKEAYEERDILHRDIHLSNIFINENAGADSRKSPTSMLGNWGFAECKHPSVLWTYHVSKPNELPELSTTSPNMPEYSDSEDEKFFNPKEQAPAPSIPRHQSKCKSKKMPQCRARSPTLGLSPALDSEVPMEVSDVDTDANADAVYRDFNLWYGRSVEETLSRTVSLQGLSHWGHDR